MEHRSERRWDTSVVRAAFALLYVAIVTRYPMWVWDDTYLLAKGFPRLDGLPWSKRLFELSFVANSGVNEFRTYGLAKLVHYVAWLAFGTNHAAYFYLMAGLMALTAAVFGQVVSSISEDERAGTLAMAALLFNPFTMFQDFHHYSYIALPLLFVALYLRLMQRQPQSNLLAVLCALAAVITGEIGAPLMIVATGAIGLLHADRRVTVTWHLVVALAVLVLTYLVWRSAVYDPGKLPRHHETDKPLLVAVADYGSAFTYLIWRTLKGSSLSRTLAAAGAINVFSIIACGAAAVIVLRLAWRALPRSMTAALLLAALGFAAAIPYLALGIFAGADAVPYRYVQPSGALLCAAASLAMARRPVLGAAAGIYLVFGFGVTYGVRIPAVAHQERVIAERVAHQRTGRSKAILMTRENGLLAPPSLLKFLPARSGLLEGWIARGVAHFDWGLTAILEPEEAAGFEPGEVIGLSP